jgi:hypothetical protein
LQPPGQRPRLIFRRLRDPPLETSSPAWSMPLSPSTLLPLWEESPWVSHSSACLASMSFVLGFLSRMYSKWPSRQTVSFSKARTVCLHSWKYEECPGAIGQIGLLQVFRVHKLRFSQIVHSSHWACRC